MDKSIKHRIIGAIRGGLSDRFRVLDNTGNNKRLIAGLFPDVLLLRREPPVNDDILFVMRIEDADTNLLDSIPIWKELERSDISFYLVVPEDKLDEARRLASAIDVFGKFAYYTIDHQGKVRMTYE